MLNGKDGISTPYFVGAIIDCSIDNNIRHGIIITAISGGFHLNNTVIAKNGGDNINTAAIATTISSNNSRIISAGGYGVRGTNLRFIAKNSVIANNTTANISVLEYQDNGGNRVTGTAGVVDLANNNFTPIESDTLRRKLFKSIGSTPVYVTAGLEGADIIYPRIDSLDKTVLPTSGGTLVGTGIGLTGATGFTLGDEACTVVVDSDTQITITVPAITAGLKSLAGTTTAGAVSITNGITAQESVAPSETSERIKKNSFKNY